MVGICGGSYDLVHKGHVNLWHQAIIKLKLKHLIIIPTYLSVFKKKSRYPKEVRLKALEYAILDLKDLIKDEKCKISLDLIEINSNKPKYTIDTIKALNLKQRPYYIVGSDCDLKSWYQADELSKMVRFAIFTRPGFKYESFNDSIYFDIESIDAASSDEKIDNFTKRVKEYVKEL